jgi:hypothetical protein
VGIVWNLQMVTESFKSFDYSIKFKTLLLSLLSPEVSEKDSDQESEYIEVKERTVWMLLIDD